MKTLALALLLAVPVAAQTPTMAPDIPAKFAFPTAAYDYERREVMIPMRDGVKLFTVIVMPKGAAHAPILLTRTPYNASKTTSRTASPNIEGILPLADAEFVEDGYIRVYQDVRGIHKSEGDYVMTRPLRGPLNPTAVDHATDAYDTIDWLVKNVPETNGKVGITGSSYPGFTSLMALIDPHPALKAAVPQSPMVDGWMGDDWFHNGAFRQSNFDYIAGQNGAKDDSKEVPTGVADSYGLYLANGSAGDYARKYGIDALPFARKIMEHPSYDAYWQGQAVDKLLGARTLSVPTMLVVGQWDQEDSYGAPAVWRALQAKAGDKLHLVIGPWRHSQVNYDARNLGPLNYPEDTALAFRRNVMKPFLDHYLKDAAPAADTPRVLTYQTGSNVWQPSAKWPLADRMTPIYLGSGASLSFTAPAKAGSDDYVSDPAKPVPFVPRPGNIADGQVWKPWLVSDQRNVSTRTDVLTYTTPPLTKAVHIAGAPMVDLRAATSGTDSDWVVKLIDVYPDNVPGAPEMNGYQLAIGMEIFRGRYRDSFEHPTAIPAGKVQGYKFALPNANHRFLPGHRIMVQVQSSWFPLYDRNPQTFVPNIFNAKPADYRKAKQTVFTGGSQASAIELPVVGD
ncbi:CocE/NonD family hydrolase [Glacieibacterium sp.]|uniref:CocE/NonD family hydrolase n=1 Tax=Glacieibacterium sp. TaxID=2860237 RepID=UPI003AFFAAE0